MQPFSHSQEDNTAPPITKLTAIPDVLCMVFDMLFPHELGNLSLTCKALHASVFSNDATTTIRVQSVLRALEMSRRAEVLSNGGLRIYTSMCRRFIDIRVVKGSKQIIPEIFRLNTERPLVSMRYEGVCYIGRGPQLFYNEAGDQLREVRSLFSTSNNSAELLNAQGSVRVHSIQRVQYPDEPQVVCTNVRIGVCLESAFHSECFATLLFVSDGW